MTPQIWKEIQAVGAGDFDERLTLYFTQRGKCLYSGTPIDINQLFNAGLYEVDHILPRSYIKDDSLENKALVLREFNQRKTDSMLLDDSVRAKMTGFWKMLLDAKLIGEKKYNNLMRSAVSENAMRGFIARQLVETSQMVKLTQSLLSTKYPDTKITPVKASMSHNLREAAGLVKCREANDFHHAHDAFLACRVGLFVRQWYPDMYDQPIRYTRAMKKYVKEQAEEFAKSRRMPGSSGFVVGRFMSSFVDTETGELWEGSEEVEGIRRALNYRQCYISRMPTEDSGAFWRGTVYSPRDPSKGTNLSLPLKGGLNPHVYGGYSELKFAYFFIYEATDKKGRAVFRFSQVPVWLASRVGGDDVLGSYARGLAESEDLSFVAIRRSKILKKQLVEIDGERLFITGSEEVRNACQFAFDSDELSLICRMIQDASGDEGSVVSLPHECDTLFGRLAERGGKIANGLMGKLSLEARYEAFSRLDYKDKRALLLQLIAIVNAADRQINLSKVGGAKTAGQYKVAFNKKLNDPNVDFYIIDQSVTGMFERRTRVGL